MEVKWVETCDQLLKLANRRQCRLTDWSPSIPCDWAPQTVWDPRFEMLFTSEGAWSFIIELLESGHVFTPVQMKKPPDTIAYETTVNSGPNRPALYIKVQIYRGKILGRSFHYSVK